MFWNNDASGVNKVSQVKNKAGHCIALNFEAVEAKLWTILKFPLKHKSSFVKVLRDTDWGCCSMHVNKSSDLISASIQSW